MRVIVRDERCRNSMNKIIVVKCGGSTLDELSPSFFKGIHLLKEQGFHPVIVHGGGPAIKRMLDILNIQSEFIEGLRKTTKEMMDVVEMVLAGKVNPTLVYKMQKAGSKSIGLNGVDSFLLETKAKNFDLFGYVGEVEKVNTTIILDCIEAGYIPIIAPVGVNQAGEKFNINADSAASAVASALQASQLIFVTDVPGILKDNVLIEEVDQKEVEQLIKEGTITGGMIPKVKGALQSLDTFVEEVMIVDGKQADFSKNGQLTGTTIKKVAEVM